jgi:hypothetical protein
VIIIIANHYYFMHSIRQQLDKIHQIHQPSENLLATADLLATTENLISSTADVPQTANLSATTDLPAIATFPAQANLPVKANLLETTEYRLATLILPVTEALPAKADLQQQQTS